MSLVPTKQCRAGQAIWSGPGGTCKHLAMLPTPCSGTVGAWWVHLREGSVAVLDQHHLCARSPGKQLSWMPIQLMQAEGGWSSACAVGLGSCVLPDLLQPGLPLICALSAAQCCAKDHPVRKLLFSFSSCGGSGALPCYPTTAPGALWGLAAAPLGVQLRPALDPAPPAVFRPDRHSRAHLVILPQMGGTKRP